MAQTAAHLVDHVIPHVPVRQWVLQLPASIPVDTLKRFSYQISMSAAQRLKLPPPMSMLNFAELINTGVPGT